MFKKETHDKLGKKQKKRRLRTKLWKCKTLHIYSFNIENNIHWNLVDTICTEPENKVYHLKIVSPNEFSTVILTLLYKKSLRASRFKIEAQFHVKALISHQSVKTDICVRYITTRKWLLEAKGWLVEAKSLPPRGWTPSFEQIPL